MRHSTDRRQWTRRLSLVALAYALPWSLATAQTWPSASKPITLVVGYPAGGSVDLVARVVAEPLARRLGRPVVVENVGGAGGTIGADRVVRAEPDGHTLLLGSGSEVSIARLFNTAVRYDGQTDLTHIGLIGVTPMVFVAGPASGVKTMTPMPCSSHSSSRSSSIQRLSMLYDGWWISSGVPSSPRIRAASREWGLPTWDKPAAACLASRVPYGTEVTVAVKSWRSYKFRIAGEVRSVRRFG